MKVRIVQEASHQVYGMSLSHYRRNQVYELPPTVANYLVAEKLAMFEMRNSEKGAEAPDGKERRHPRSGPLGRDVGYASDAEYSS